VAGHLVWQRLYETRTREKPSMQSRPMGGAAKPSGFRRSPATLICMRSLWPHPQPGRGSKIR